MGQSQILIFILGTMRWILIIIGIGALGFGVHYGYKMYLVNRIMSVGVGIDDFDADRSLLMTKSIAFLTKALDDIRKPSFDPYSNV